MFSEEETIILLFKNKTTNEDKRKEHQRDLGRLLNESARERLAQQTGQKDTKVVKKSNVSYKNFEKFPKEPEVDELKVYVGMDWFLNTASFSFLVFA